MDITRGKVLEAIYLMLSFFNAVRAPLSLEMAVALRMIARLALSPEWKALIERGQTEGADSDACESMQEAAFTQATDYAVDSGRSEYIDRHQVREHYGMLLRNLATSEVNVSDKNICGAFLAISDLIVDGGDSNAPSAEQMNRAVEMQVFALSADTGLFPN